MKPWNSICVKVFTKPIDMKSNVQTLRTNKVKKAKMKLSKHRELGIDSTIDIHEVATLMDTLKNRSTVENDALLFSINMN